jgi:hypothetical protein
MGSAEELEWARAKKGLAGKRLRLVACLGAAARLAVGVVILLSYFFVPASFKGLLAMYVASPAIAGAVTFFGLFKLLGGELPEEYRRGLR